MTSALRWAAMRAILTFHNCDGQCHKTVSTDHNFWRERRAEADLNRGPSAYQPNALPLGQTGSLHKVVFCFSLLCPPPGAYTAVACVFRNECALFSSADLQRGAAASIHHSHRRPVLRRTQVPQPCGAEHWGQGQWQGQCHSVHSKPNAPEASAFNSNTDPFYVWSGSLQCWAAASNSLCTGNLFRSTLIRSMGLSRR